MITHISNEKKLLNDCLWLDTFFNKIWMEERVSLVIIECRIYSNYQRQLGDDKQGVCNLLLHKRTLR